MIVFYKDKSGWRVRPAYIGFIKNNYIRRAAMILFAPVMFCISTVIGLALASLAFISLTFRAFWLPIVSMVPSIKERWNEPRRD